MGKTGLVVWTAQNPRGAAFRYRTRDYGTRPGFGAGTGMFRRRCYFRLLCREHGQLLHTT